MATIEQKREERRRKILENSEKRMKKLLGYDYAGEEKEKPFLLNRKTSKEPSERQFIPSRVPDNATDDSNDKDILPETSCQTSVKLSSSEITTNNLNTLDRTRFCSNICLAIIVRWLLSIELASFFFESIFFPFAALEIAIFSYQCTCMKDIRLPHGFALVTSVLMLFGLNPEVLRIVNRILGYVIAIAEDCGLYIFTFFVCDEIIKHVA